MDAPVYNRRVEIGGVDCFYREAGPADAPVLLLPHGYPCSSFEFRNLMRCLGNRWRLLAPDFPGSGYSSTPEDFAYDFEGFSHFLEQFADKLRADRFVLYLHDFGTWIGLRFAMRRPERLMGLIIQNGDIYADTLGPKYGGLKEIWGMDRHAGIEKLKTFVDKEHFKDEFLNEVRPELAALIPPDMWELHWPLMSERRRDNAAAIIYDINDEVSDWFPRFQQFLRSAQPSTLILWGPQDGYMPEASGRAYLRDLPEAELHMLDGGHWLLETSLACAVERIAGFLDRVHRRT